MIDWSKIKTAEQKETERLAALAVSARAERDKRLAATDFYMLQDAPPAPEGLAAHRQALRDVTQQAGFPENIIWPEL